jgi:hypothetical protein
LGARRVHSAYVRDLTGADELMAHELCKALTVEVSTRLLTACVVSLHTDENAIPPSEEHVRGLSAGDRELLLLALRRAAYGDRLDLVVTCPDVSCCSKMDVTLSISDMLRGPDAGATARAIDGTAIRVVTGEDLHAVAALALDDPDAAARQLAARIASDDGSSSSFHADELAFINAALAQLDPHADHELMLTCPDCGLDFTSSVDAGDLLRQEMAGSITELELSVHLMATNYHWCEREIVALPIARRRRYLRVLSDALTAPVRH